MYISNKNAARIDFIRNTIEAWHKEKLLTELEFYYLLAGLIEGVPAVSNITGTYGAYLKHWDKRAYKDFEMARLDVINNKRANKSYNKDANKLIEELSEVKEVYIERVEEFNQIEKEYREALDQIMDKKEIISGK